MAISGKPGVMLYFDDMVEERERTNQGFLKTGNMPLVLETRKNSSSRILADNTEWKYIIN